MRRFVVYFQVGVRSWHAYLTVDGQRALVPSHVRRVLSQLWEQLVESIADTELEQACSEMDKEEES